ncbi:MAG: PLP-dependent transferase, partial [Acidimicrobiales bacterium]
MKPESRAAQALGSVDPATRALVPPIHPSTTFERAADGSYPGTYEYTRADNPTYDVPERLLAELEEREPQTPVVVLGDLNDFEDSAPLTRLTEGGRLVD